MSLIVDAKAAIPAKVERVLHHLGIVARERNDRSGVRIIVDDLSESVGCKELVILGEALGQLHSQAVVDGIGAALEFLNARKACNGARQSDLIHSGSLSRPHKSDGCRRFRTLQIDIARTRQVRSFNPEVVDLNRQSGLDLIFEAQVGLLHVGLVIIGLEDINGWSACGATDRRGTAWSCDRSAALSGGILRDVCAGKVESLHIQCVVGESGADGDGRSATIENTVACTNDQLLAERRPCNTEPGTEVGMIVVNVVGEETRSREAGTGVEHGRLGDQVEVVSEAEVQSEVIPHAPFILGEGRIFLKIGIRGGPRGAGASEGLRKRVRSVRTCKACTAAAVQVAAESLQAVENVRAREVAREEISDLVHENIQTRLDGVTTIAEREGIADFATMNVGEARAKEIASDNEIGNAALANGGLRIDAVSQAGLVVARIRGPGNVDDTG